MQGGRPEGLTRWYVSQPPSIWSLTAILVPRKPAL
jgi:hypothetical protein